jgi:formylglycine-generating enzyme required for sulfatase activity
MDVCGSADRLRSAGRLAALVLLAASTACGPTNEAGPTAVAVCDSTSKVDQRSGLREFRDCPNGPVMVVLPPGQFLMGSPAGEEPAALNPDRPEWTELAEQPQVEVEIADSFAIGKYEITFAEWDRCVEAGGCTYRPDDEGWGRRDRPVVNIARMDAEEYIAWLSEVTGHQYRLPSEAEWEYAARAGTTTARYWGNELGRGMAVCDGCGSEWDKRSTAPIGSFAPNPFGLHDMLGNVEEWVADCWVETHAAAPRDGSARVEDSPWWSGGECERPVQRGGAWSYYPWTVRAAARSFWRPGPWTDREDRYGFRLVRMITPVGEARASTSASASTGGR